MLSYPGGRTGFWLFCGGDIVWFIGARGGCHCEVSGVFILKQYVESRFPGLVTGLRVRLLCGKRGMERGFEISKRQLKIEKEKIERKR